MKTKIPLHQVAKTLLDESIGRTDNTLFIEADIASAIIGGECDKFPGYKDTVSGKAAFDLKTLEMTAKAPEATVVETKKEIKITEEKMHHPSEKQANSILKLNIKTGDFYFIKKLEFYKLLSLNEIQQKKCEETPKLFGIEKTMQGENTVMYGFSEYYLRKCAGQIDASKPTERINYSYPKKAR